MRDEMMAGVMRAPKWWADGFDLLLTPTMAQLPPAIAGFDRRQTGAVFGLFTLPFSITGQPAISLPLH